MAGRVWCDGEQWGAVPLRSVGPAVGLGAAAVGVLAAIAAHANADGEAWPDRDTLAGTVGVNVGTVTRSVRKLVDAGLIETRPRLSRGRKVGTVYRLVAPPRGRRADAPSADPHGKRADAPHGKRADAPLLEQTKEQKEPSRDKRGRWSDEAREIATGFYDWHQTNYAVKPVTAFAGLVQVASLALDGGWTTSEVKRAMVACARNRRAVTKTNVWLYASEARGQHERSERHDEVAAIQAANLAAYEADRQYREGDHP